jgi:multiple sugar transport system permease protein
VSFSTGSSSTGSAPKRRRGLGNIPNGVFLTIASVLFLLPVVWIFSTSVKPTADIFAIPSTLLPHHVTGANYGAAVGGNLAQYMMNSLIAAGGGTLIALLLAIPAAFGFAKFRYRISGLLFAAAVLTRMFPPIALGIPYFLELRSVNLIDTRLGLTLAYVPVVLPLVLWILEGFFRDFSQELIEAARMDGLGVVRTLVRIVLPISTPAIAVASLFGFLSAWNEFVIALTVTRTPAASTMPVGISSYVTQFQTFWGQMTAAAALYLLPVLILTVVAQRGIVRGLTMGSTKG